MEQRSRVELENRQNRAIVHDGRYVTKLQCLHGTEVYKRSYRIEPKLAITSTFFLP